MIPTVLPAQMSVAVNPGVHVGGVANPGATARGGVERGIPGADLGTWRGHPVARSPYSQAYCGDHQTAPMMCPSPMRIA
jgi:hypothetical protein